MRLGPRPTAVREAWAPKTSANGPSGRATYAAHGAGRNFASAFSCLARHGNLISSNRKLILTITQIRSKVRSPRARRRDASRSSRNVGHGMRWTLRRQVIFHRTKTQQRTAKSCGPGAATLALPAGVSFRTTGARKAASPGRARINRKTIARGKPGCLGCTCSSTPVLFFARGLRAQSAPGFPCAL